MKSKNLPFSMIETGIGELVLSQPEKRNAINASMWEALPKVLAALEETPDLRVLIVRGDGDHFASGADISEFETLYATRQSAKSISDAIAKAMTALADFPIPVIAQIRGACVGGGCGLALCCDLRFTDSSGKFAITPARLGLVYPYEDIKRLIEIVGIAHAKDILYSARVIDAPEAAHMGLVNRVFSPDDLQPHVLDYARNIAHLSPQSARASKQMFKAFQAGQNADTAQTRELFEQGFASADFREGYRAFLAKRKPDF